jgi:hypothetical protein
MIRRISLLALVATALAALTACEQPTGVAVLSELQPLLSSTPTAIVQNPDNGHYYQAVRVQGGITYADAKAAAAALSHLGVQGHLVTITSQAENDFIVNTFPEAVNPDPTSAGWSRHEGYWIGAERVDANNWQWVTGEPFSYSNWSPGEPNNSGGVENRINFWPTWPGPVVGKWNDRDGTAPVHGYVVEFSPPADTSPPVITPSVSGTLGDNGWYTSDVTVSWNVSDPESDITNTSGCGATTVDDDTDGVTFTCTATSAGGTTSESVTIKRDATNPEVSFAGNAGSYTVDQTVAISCAASDATSGLASSDCPEAAGDAYTFGLGSHTLSASATDAAGNASSASTTFSVGVSSESLCALVERWVTQRGTANALCQQLRNGAIQGFQNLVRAQTGRHVPAAYASLLLPLS